MHGILHNDFRRSVTVGVVISGSFDIIFINVCLPGSMDHCEIIVQFSSTYVLFQKEGNVIFTGTLVGIRWLDIG